MKFLALIFLSLSMGTAFAADVSDGDVAAAITSRYGPFAANEAVSVNVNSRTNYDGGEKLPDPSLPEGFQAVVWDRKTNRFAALVGLDGEKPVRIAGNAVLQREMPVPTRRIAPGEILKAEDLVMRTLKATAAGNNSVSDIADAVGREATKVISPDRLIPTDSLTAPAAVKKNEEIVLVFKKGELELNSKGKSLDNAAIGDAVKVTRPDAERVLEGRVIANGVVLVNEAGSIR